MWDMNSFCSEIGQGLSTYPSSMSVGAITPLSFFYLGSQGVSSINRRANTVATFEQIYDSPFRFTSDQTSIVGPMPPNLSSFTRGIREINVYTDLIKYDYKCTWLKPYNIQSFWSVLSYLVDHTDGTRMYWTFPGDPDTIEQYAGEFLFLADAMISNHWIRWNLSDDFDSKNQHQ
jgi:hypothetical protein